ncbi:MAG: sodium/proton-translocating pyrophosphatase, partial [Flammeovirgaceae bacterium]
NVGDCAGQAADLFESIAAEVISAMILGSTLAGKMPLGAIESKSGFLIFPLIIHCFDIVASCVGSHFVRTKEGIPLGNDNNKDIEDPLVIMKKGYFVTLFLGLIGIFTISYLLLDSAVNPHAWI